MVDTTKRISLKKFINDECNSPLGHIVFLAHGWNDERPPEEFMTCVLTRATKANLSPSLLEVHQVTIKLVELGYIENGRRISRTSIIEQIIATK